MRTYDKDWYYKVLLYYDTQYIFIYKREREIERVREREREIF